MALSAAPQTWYRPPPFADDIRGWDEFYLNSPRPSSSNRLKPDLDFVLHPNSHGQNYPTLAFTPEIFSHRAGSPSLSASSRKTLKTSLGPHPHTLNPPKPLDEATQSAHNQQNNHHRERSLPSPALTEPPDNQGSGASNQGRPLAESCSIKCTSKGSKGTRRGRCEEGQRHLSCGRWRLLLQVDSRGVSCRRDPPVWRSGKQQFGFGKRFGVTSFGGPKEFCRIIRGQRNKRNTGRVSGHSHRCLATTPPILLLSEGATPTNFNPRDSYGSYPKDFCTMAANNDTTKEEVSTSRQGSVPT